MTAGTTKNHLGLSVNYPVTQTFPGSWTGVLSYSVILIILVVLTIVNVALVGYDSVTDFRTEFNQTDRHWYNKLIPTFRSHEDCNPIAFQVGDTVRTNFSAFDWQIESIMNKSMSDNKPASHFEYRGELLDDCAATKVIIVVYYPQPKIEGLAIAQCRFSNGIGLNMSALLPFSNTGSDLPIIKVWSRLVHSNASIVRETLFQASSGILGFYNDNTDLTKQVLDEKVISYQFEHCSKTASRPECSSEMVKDLQDKYREFEEAKTKAAGEEIDRRFSDLSRIVVSATKLDFGNINDQNNIYLNYTSVESTLRESAISQFGAFFTDDYDGELPLPLSNDSSRIQQTYLCRAYKLKSPGSLFAQVFAATSTQVLSIWQGAVVIAAWRIKRNSNTTNYSKVPVKDIESSDSHSSETRAD